MDSNKILTDILIIGSGAAGATIALDLASKNRKVTLLSKRTLRDGTTRYAQGGIAAVMDPINDNHQLHMQDTLEAGDDLCDQTMVELCISKGKKAIDWLEQTGVKFSHENSQPNSPLHLTKEGGHSRRRVVHAHDATGKEISQTLTEKIHQQVNIERLEYHIAVDLIIKNKGTPDAQCIGAYALNIKQKTVITIQANVVILATGGASKVYLYTSNPDYSTGDGIAMAWRAGCCIANMEFNQFHPTCLYHPKAKSFLLSEALRGEGAKLKLPDGQEFMQKFDSRKELAPRDIVARAIDYEMKRNGLDYVLLDISHREKDFIIGHFPNIYQRCLEFGYDITQQAIPVVPAAHYTCGGIMIDQHAKTDIANLYAIGETSYSGLHGANRMASNSLLECIVFAHSAATHILQHEPETMQNHLIENWDASRVTISEEEVIVTHNWDELRRVMWDYVGIVRSNKRLVKAKQRVDLLANEINDYYSQYAINSDLIELRNLVLVADLMIRSAMYRKESRGLHYTSDYPYKDDQNFQHPTKLCLYS